MKTTWHFQKNCVNCKSFVICKKIFVNLQKKLHQVLDIRNNNTLIDVLMIWKIFCHKAMKICKTCPQLVIPTSKSHNLVTWINNLFWRIWNDQIRKKKQTHLYGDFKFKLLACCLWNRKDPLCTIVLSIINRFVIWEK